MPSFPHKPYMRSHSVALEDQTLAAALDALREAEHWVLLVPAPPEQPQAAVAVMASANGEFVLHALAGLQRAAQMMAMKYMLEELDEESEE